MKRSSTAGGTKTSAIVGRYLEISDLVDGWGQRLIGGVGEKSFGSHFLVLLVVKMKIKAGNRRGWDYNVPLPIALLLGVTFFFVGYHFSITFQEDIVSEKENQETQRLQLLENDIEFAVEHGESGEDTMTDIPFKVLSWAPRALLYPRFATKRQCENIIALAKPHLSPSGLAVKPGGTRDHNQRIRTSTSTFLRFLKDKTGSVDIIEKKMAKAAMIPQENGESFNVIRYKIGQKYDAHYDVFHPSKYGPQNTTRVASMLLYLSDVEEGGETVFPYENYERRNLKHGEWCVGLKVKPRQGDALLFYSLHPDGTADQASLHGSCPVVKGEKWVATKWLRNGKFD